MELSQVYCFTQAPVLKPFRNVYFAAGAGIIQNQLTDIRRSLITQEGRIYIFPGTSRSIGAALPFTAGFHIHFHDFWGYRRITAGISYRLTVATGEGLDGYNDPPPVFRNRHSDMFGVLCAGIAYHFGPVGLYQ
jgi:hypothetical protein